jgi:hypothetical protein
MKRRRPHAKLKTRANRGLLAPGLSQESFSKIHSLGKLGHLGPERLQLIEDLLRDPRMEFGVLRFPAAHQAIVHVPE